MTKWRSVKWNRGFIAAMLLGLLCVTPTSAANGSIVYSYDALGRIRTASYDTGVCIIYNYDAVGNRTAESVRVSGSGSVGVWGCFNWNAALWGTQ